MKTFYVKEILYCLVVATLLVTAGYGSWRLERWFHWKFSYGPKVEQRIQEVEKRQTDLERRIEKLEKTK